MMSFTSQISILLLLLLSATTLHSTNHTRLVPCNEKDRGILLSFKQGIIDDFDYLSTWLTQQDCCAWKGVHCHNITGRVTDLQLRGIYDEEEGQFKYLKGEMNLSHNSFSGSIPRHWENMKDLSYIDLWNNKLSGEVLEYLSNWRSLKVMVLGKNEFSGTIPVNLPQDLRVIILRDNQFEGNIPPELFNLSSLFHLDLAHNKLSGSLPQCVYNMTKMVWNNMSTGFSVFIIDWFTKGQHYENSIDGNRRTFDLSVNNLSGEIPSELFEQLIQVQTLNLSYNHFMGTIPETIGDMKYLESLDLSNNKLSGEIPQNMTLLTFLGYLNLSCNNFIGQIPTGTQLQSFDVSSYSGNPELCGAPLKNCTTKGEGEGEDPEDGSDPLRESLYLGMGVGFAVGFWGICGSLLLIRKWRHTYYRFLHRVADNLYVTWMVKLNNFAKTQPPAN